MRLPSALLFLLPGCCLPPIAAISSCSCLSSVRTGAPGETRWPFAFANQLLTASVIRADTRRHERQARSSHQQPDFPDRSTRVDARRDEARRTQSFLKTASPERDRRFDPTPSASSFHHDIRGDPRASRMADRTGGVRRLASGSPPPALPALPHARSCRRHD